MVSGLVTSQFSRMGMPEHVIKDNMEFTLAQQALKMFCGFDAPDRGGAVTEIFRVVDQQNNNRAHNLLGRVGNEPDRCPGPPFHGRVSISRRESWT